MVLLARRSSLAKGLVGPDGNVESTNVDYDSEKPETAAAQPLPTLSEFTKAIRDAKRDLRSSPITSMEIHQRPLSGVLNSTLWGHQYIVATVKLPTGGLTYCRFDVYKNPDANVSDPQGLPRCDIRVDMSDDYESPSIKDPDSHLISSLSLTSARQSVAGGPSLESLAALCEAFEGHLKDTGDKYSAFGRNCIWFASLILFGMAKRFSEHWLAGGHSFPRNLMDNFMRGVGTPHRTALKCIQKRMQEMKGSNPLSISIGLIGNGLVYAGILDSDFDTVLTQWNDYARARTN